MREKRTSFKIVLHAVLAVLFTFGLPLYGALPTLAVIATGSTAGGTSVTITGTDFTGATAVTTGGVAAASCTVDSATIISATTGNWSAGATWVGGTAPVAGDDVIIASGHTVTLTAAVDITTGNLTVTGTLALGGFNLTAGSLSGAGPIGSASGTPLVTVGSNGSSTTYSGIYSRAGAQLIKEGAGTFTLSGANTYTGATTVAAGTLRLGSANERISNSSALIVAIGATFDLNGRSETVASLAGAGTITSSSAGAVTLTNGGTTTTAFSGIIQNGSGTVALTKSGASTSTNNVGIFADTAPGNLTLQLRENDVAPGTGGLVFSDFSDLVLGGGDYEFLVKAELRGAGVVVNTNDKGLWAKHATNGLVLLAREGSEAPGVPGSTFFRITQFALPGTAQPMFQASMRTGTGGVTTANDTGLWMINKANEVKLAMREGDVINVGGTNRTVTAITALLNGTTTGGARGRRGFVADGQLTVLLTFSGGIQAHAKVVVP